MKKLLSFFLAFTFLFLVAFAPLASAADVFTRKLTNLQDATGNSAAFNTGLLTKKTVVFQAYTTGGTEKTMQGTAALYCGATSTGPFVPARDIGGAVITTTANGSFDIGSLCPYLRVTWTKTNNRLSTWLFYSE